MREEKVPGLSKSLARDLARAAFTIAFALVVITSLTCISLAKTQYKTLHTFKQTGGKFPVAGLVADPQGNLYGTTEAGGATGAGTVFKLTPKDHAGWKETVLHSFNGTDGADPVAGLIFDSAGNLYGTASAGGANRNGVVFELTPNGHGGWNETVLSSLPGGGPPDAGLIFDAAGNLYGTTLGSVFELTPDGHGGWNETVLHSFNGSDGQVCKATLVFDSAGNLYGTTQEGGANNYGTVFELTPDGHGGWNETVLHSFYPTSGARPTAGVIFDTAGNLYGTTALGGAHRGGTVFKLSPNGHGGWKQTVLHSFKSRDGASPHAGLVFDVSGNLYGTTEAGGASGAGTVFKLAPDGQGGWNETVLHSFKNGPSEYPVSSLIFDGSGHLYGTTGGSQVGSFGSVFEIAP